MLNNYSRIRLITPHYESEGVPLGSIGYLIETYPDGAYEVEFSAPDGTTIAQLVLNDAEVQLAELSIPVKEGRIRFTSATQRIAEGQGIPHEEFWRAAEAS
jgi:hypothetical protein